MKLAFLYSGQGSQYVGMGKEVYEHFPIAKEIFDSTGLDFDVKQLCFEGPLETLSQTQYTQACMVTLAIAVTEVLKQAGIAPDYTAGLSLGEYAALYAAGVFDKKTALELVRFRGIAMQKACEGLSCKMAAVLNLGREELKKACQAGSAFGKVEICNFNCPGQLVISGEAKAVDAACQEALKLGARRTVELNVSGPFHTSFMEPASRALKEKFAATAFGKMQVPVVFNCTARPLEEGKTVADMLIEQVKSPVYFEDTIRYLHQMGVDTVVEIGPGKTLSGFVKKTCGDMAIYQAETLESIQKTIAALKG